jgi:uncharacterized protein YjbJ (UPF0337 family)
MMPRDDTIIGDWKKMRDKVKARWHAFSDEDLNAIDGSRAQLVSLVQLHYGLPMDRAEADVEEFLEENESAR